MGVRKYATLAERVLARVVLRFDSETSCWLFPFNMDRAGYGCVSYRVPGAGRSRGPVRIRAHKVIWEWVHGRKVRTGYTLDHHPECIKACCNPDHLEEVSRPENTRRMMYWRYHHREIDSETQQT